MRDRRGNNLAKKTLQIALLYASKFNARAIYRVSAPDTALGCTFSPASRVPVFHVSLPVPRGEPFTLIRSFSPFFRLLFANPTQTQRVGPR